MSIAKNIEVAIKYGDEETIFKVFNYCTALKAQVILSLLDAADLERVDMSEEERAEIIEEMRVHVEGLMFIGSHILQYRWNDDL